MTALTLPIGPFDSPVSVNSPVTVGNYPAPYTLDLENVEIVGGSGTAMLSLVRGANGTARASHAAGTTLTAGWGGGGGGGVTVDPVSGPTFTAGTLIAPGAVEGPSGSATLLTLTGTGGYNIFVQQPAGAQANGAYIELDNDPGTGAGGNVGIGGADGAAGFAGGEAFLYGGSGDVDGGQANPGTVDAYGGKADGTGGNIELQGGQPKSGSGKAGGDIKLQTRAGDGAGRHGQVILAGLPTADPGIAGAVYSDGAPSAGVPKALMVSGG